MKALILAGGTGIRLRPFTYSIPKQLVSIANRPVLDYVIQSVRDAGITDIGLIVGTREDAFRAAVGDGARLAVRLTYLRQDRPLGLAHAVRLAHPFLGTSDFLMHLGDNYLSGGVAAAVREFRDRRPTAQLVLHRVTDPRAFGVAEVRPDGRVTRVEEKPARPRSDLAVTGAYLFTEAVHKAVEAIEPSARGELEITDAVQWLVDSGADVRGREHHGFWRDVGGVDDLLAVNREVLGGLPPAVRGDVDAASELRGRVVVERGARVIRSRVEGPAIIGAGTVVEDSRIDPATSIGRDCVIRTAQLADSVVFDGARIEAIGALSGSVIGRHATIRTAEPDRTGHRLIVGDHTYVGTTR